MSKESAVEMFVGGLVMDPNTQAPVIILKDESGKINIPIWIGIAEATSIASAIKQINMARPLTHDLMQFILTEVGVSVERVIITELKDSTYFAEIILSRGDQVLIVDARPSDAIAMALRSSSPIFVAEKVLEQARVAIETNQMPPIVDPNNPEAGNETAPAEETTEEQTDFKNIDKDKWNDLLKELDPDDFKYKM